jgi:hypothetical protein
MKRHCLSALCFLSAMASLCCANETIDYVSKQEQGGTGTGQTGSSGSSGGAGGYPGTGGTVIGSPREYRRSGYGGGPEGWLGVVLENGMTVSRDEELAACNNDGTVTRTYVDIASCTAATLCSPLCTNDDECPRGGTAAPRCVQCATGGISPWGAMCFSVASACVLECTSSSQCPNGMGCLMDVDGRNVCMFVDAPWSPECPGYCMESGFPCHSAPCCDGLSCADDGYCAPTLGPTK